MSILKLTTFDNSNKVGQLHTMATVHTKPGHRSFRPWPENHERLELADRIGLNVSELINEVLKENLKNHLERKTKKLREALGISAN